MRKLTIATLVLCASSAWAQSVSVGDIIEPLVPGLVVSVIRESPLYVNGLNVCGSLGPKPIPWECGGSPAFQTSPGSFTIGVDAAGNSYYVTEIPHFIDFGNGRHGNLLRRVSPTGATEDLARVLRTLCLSGDCSASIGYGPQNLFIDATAGRILMTAYADYCSPCTGEIGIVEISGLPTLFDTLLTFIPDGQTISLLTPAHPDGFRSADSLQLWSGDLHSLPDWSQAQPLACAAAISPTPGQIVTVADTFPNPSVGQGRYYVTASQHGTDRRLGRQLIGQTMTARNPALLPVCIQP
jgi:hypothetical protein